MIIHDEESAFIALQQALNGEFEGVVESPELKNWPIITFKFNGPRFHGTLTPSVMKGMIEIQDGLNRTWASFVHGHDDARHLRDDERTSIEYVAKVEEGSSLVTIDLSSIGTQLVNQMAGKMDGTQLLILVLGGMTLWAGKTAWSLYLDKQIRERELDNERQRSADETDRMRILSEALTRDPRLPMVKTLADDSRLSIIRGATTAESAELNGELIDHGMAVSLAQARRTRSKPVQMNGNYFVRNVDTSHPEVIKLRVEDAHSGRLFSATFEDETMERRQLELLRDAEWGRSSVYLMINAAELRGQITTAEVLGVGEASAKA